MFNKNTTSQLCIAENNVCTLVKNTTISGQAACEYLMRATNRGVVLLSSYAIQIVDFPDGITFDNAYKGIKFKLREFIDYPVEDCQYDLISIPDEQNKGKFYLVTINKKEVLSKFNSLNIKNIKVIDILENTLLNVANTYIKSTQASLCIFDMGEYSHIILIYKNAILSFRKIEISSTSDFDLWISEIQRSIDIFERQYRFTSINEIIIFNTYKDKEDEIGMLLKNPIYVQDVIPEGISREAHTALIGLACRTI